jgi:hypothetical protein
VGVSRLDPTVQSAIDREGECVLEENVASQRRGTVPKCLCVRVCVCQSCRRGRLSLSLCAQGLL